MMQFDRMARRALDTALEPMHGMTGGIGDLLGLVLAFPMTLDAHGAGDDDFLVGPGRNPVGPFQKRLDQHLVAIENRRVVAGMAFHVFMDAGLPSREGLLHDVTIEAEFRIVLRVIVEMERPRADHGQQKKDLQGNDDPVFKQLSIIVEHRGQRP